MQLTRNGVRLAYDEVGDGPGSALLLHGMACNRTHNAALAGHLADRYRVVNLDMRGHGESDAPEGEGAYAMDEFTADVHHVITELGLDRPLVVGHSFGGTVTLAYAATHPHAQPGAIVLLDSGMRSNAVLNADLSPFYESLRAADDAGFRAILDEFVRARLVDPLDGPDHIDLMVSDMGSVAKHVFLSMSTTVQGTDAASLAARCQVPALLIRSRQGFVDPAVLPGLGPNWHVGQVVGAGHFVQVVVPEQVHPMIDRFLAVIDAVP